LQDLPGKQQRGLSAIYVTIISECKGVKQIKQVRDSDQHKKGTG